VCKTFDGAWKDSKIDEIVGARLKWKVFVSFHAIYRREAAHPTSSQVSSRRDKRRRRRRLDGRGSTELFHFIRISFSSFKARVSAAAEIFSLVKDKVLTAFSVGFRIMDAEYNAAAEIFMIKELELVEISIVSVPCNQNTVFNLSKAFDNTEDYSKFKEQ